MSNIATKNEWFHPKLFYETTFGWNWNHSSLVALLKNVKKMLFKLSKNNCLFF